MTAQCANFGFNRGDRVSRLSGWEGCQLGCIPPVNHNLWTIDISREKSKLTLQFLYVPTIVDNR